MKTELPTIVIQLQPNGNVGIQTNIDKPVPCYGMLELARQAMTAHFAQSAEQNNGRQIVLVAADVLKQLK